MYKCNLFLRAQGVEGVPGTPGRPGLDGLSGEKGIHTDVLLLKCLSAIKTKILVAL
jgi:hypothetical protein